MGPTWGPPGADRTQVSWGQHGAYLGLTGPRFHGANMGPTWGWQDPGFMGPTWGPPGADRTQVSWGQHGAHLGLTGPRFHGANMGPTWGRQDPVVPQVGHVNLAIWDTSFTCNKRDDFEPLFCFLKHSWIWYHFAYYMMRCTDLYKALSAMVLTSFLFFVPNVNSLTLWVIIYDVTLCIILLLWTISYKWCWNILKL